MANLDERGNAKLRRMVSGDWYTSPTSVGAASAPEETSGGGVCGYKSPAQLPTNEWHQTLDVGGSSPLRVGRYYVTLLGGVPERQLRNGSASAPAAVELSAALVCGAGLSRAAANFSRFHDACAPCPLGQVIAAERSGGACEMRMRITTESPCLSSHTSMARTDGATPELTERYLVAA